MARKKRKFEWGGGQSWFRFAPPAGLKRQRAFTDNDGNDDDDVDSDGNDSDGDDDNDDDDDSVGND